MANSILFQDIGCWGIRDIVRKATLYSICKDFSRNTFLTLWYQKGAALPSLTLRGPSQASDSASLAWVSPSRGGGHRRLSAPAGRPFQSAAQAHCPPAAWGERPALTAMSHPADRVLAAVDKLIFWFYFKSRWRTIASREVTKQGTRYKEATCGSDGEGEEGGSELLGGHSYPSQDSSSAFHIHSLSVWLPGIR